MSLAERLQELRKTHNDSQEQLAEKIGVSRQAVSKWESGQGSPDLNNIVKISEVYTVSIDYIVKGTAPDLKPVKKEKKLDKGIKTALIFLLIFFGIMLGGVVFLSLLTFAMRLIAAIG